MADPFSILVGTVGLLDVCVKFGGYLSDVIKDAQNIESDLNGLKDEINALAETHRYIQAMGRKLSKTSSFSGPHHDQDLEVSNIWKGIDANADDCSRTIKQLEEEVTKIMGKSQQAEPTGRRDRFRKVGNLRSSHPQLAKLNGKLSTLHRCSQLGLAYLTLFYNQEANDTQLRKSDEILKMQAETKSLIIDLKSRGNDTDSIGLLKTIEAATSSKQLNEHFMPPRSVSSIFVGRENDLEELRNSLENGESLELDVVQKRFVVQGLGGSGKTEFCCRFAQLNRQKFWGVFSVDATSVQTATESFATIAKIGGVEPNDRAAKSWLGELEKPWLLIIDNADDPKMNITELFPPGERGFILITTRVPENTALGTIGSKSFVFDKLKEEDATRLFFLSADLPAPHDQKTKEGAGVISKILGYLPLALIHAGTAIRRELCPVDGYIEHLSYIWNDIRRRKRQPGAINPQHLDLDNNKDDDKNMLVYSTYEILYRKLDSKGSEEMSDALDLLRIFSFFNRENIRFDLLMAAARNTRPKSAGEDDKPKTLIQKLRDLTWKEWLFAIRVEMLKDRSPPVLPPMFRDVAYERINLSQFETRLRLALSVLCQYSLITRHKSTNSYSIHPLVHFWVRIRPQMSLGDQAIWAQVAKNTISNSITLPLAGISSEEDLDFHRSLLLHIMNLRERQSEIRAEIKKNQTQLGWIWPVIAPKSDLEVVDRNQASQCAKLSYVYGICGKWDEALALQEAVKEFLVPNFGWENEYSIRIGTHLANTFLLNGRFNEAGTLIEQTLQAAINFYKEDHRITLETMDKLGSIRVLQGRLQEAEEMYSRAIQGMSKTFGPEDPVTLRSVDDFGLVFWHKFEFNEALKHHMRALKGLEPTLGPRHELTLYAKEHIALAYCEINEKDLEEAHKYMNEVFEVRTKLLGREQPFTLLAKSNLAYVKHKMGDHESAEIMLREGLVVAERNLGKNHHGVLAAKVRLARVLTFREQWEEAKKIFDFVLDLNNYAKSKQTHGAIKGYHISWVFALYHYVLFWELQGKIKEALAQCETLCDVVKKSKHRIRDIVHEKREDLSKRVGLDHSLLQQNA